MSIGIDTFTIALIFTVLGIGVFISFKILNITDLTVEASYAFGAVICGLMCSKGLPFLAYVCAFLGGSFAGLITALLHTKLKINAILSGILTLTAFYSINLIVADSKSTISLMEFDQEAKEYVSLTLMPSADYMKLLVMIGVVAVVILATIMFFRTRLGMSIRACGDNEQMAKAQCISTDNMKIIGLCLSNGLVALAGALFVQFQGSYSTNMEKGMMVVGVATIIIGEIITLKTHSMWIMLLGITGGSIVYRLIYGLVLGFDFIKSRDLQVIQVGFLILILVIGVLTDSGILKRRLKKAEPEKEADHNA